MDNYPPGSEYDSFAPWNDQSKTYLIRITVEAFTEVEVNALDYEKAILSAKDLYYNGYVNDPNDWNIKSIIYE
jgi:hypothetical protein